MRLKLECSLAEYDALWAATEGRAQEAKVDRAALRKLLQDHSRILARHGNTVVDAWPPSTLARAGEGEVVP